MHTSIDCQKQYYGITHYVAVGCYGNCVTTTTLGGASTQAQLNKERYYRIY